MTSLLIKKSRLIDPTTGMDEVTDILILDGIISKIGKNLEDHADRIITALGLITSPGFIDLHAHLRDPGNEEKETIATGLKAAAKGGFTTICCMPNTNPAIDNETVVQFIMDQAKKTPFARLLPIGAVTRRREGKELADLEELAKAGVVGFSDDGNPVTNGQIFQMALIYAKDLNLPVIDHCEDLTLSLSAGINEGRASFRLGLNGYPSAAEESFIARDIALAHHTGGHFHAAHVSTEGGVELIRQAKSRGIPVSAEVTPHHLTMTEDWTAGIRSGTLISQPLGVEAYDSRTKVSPPLRTDADRQALVDGLKTGIIDMIATDHAPHAFQDKSVPFEEATVGISVLETAFASLMGLVHAKELDIATLVHRLTAGPAALLGSRFTELATLKPGTIADLVLLDPDLTWEVNSSKFISKGTNTPLDGTKMKGRVVFTLFGGATVHDELPEFSKSPEGD